MHEDLIINQGIWTYESKFENFRSNRRVNMRRRRRIRTATPCITLTLKHGGGSVMVEVAFGNCKVWKLHQVKGKLNQTGYHNILQHHTIPSGPRLVGQNFVLVQDNDPKHTSKLCQRIIKSRGAAWHSTDVLADAISVLIFHWTDAGWN